MRRNRVRAILEPKVLHAPFFYNVVVEFGLRDLVWGCVNLVRLERCLLDFPFFLVSAQVTENFGALRIRESIEISQ
jgi:hypothetical protein